MKNHALSEQPSECCGLIIETNNNLNVFPCHNIANNTIFHFKISYKDFIRASNLGKLKAYYHSHASSECLDDFSLFDQAVSSGHQYPLILYLVKLDRFKIFNSDLKNKYLGIPFKWQENDCLSLVRLFYKEEFNIDLIDTIRDKNWSIDEPNRIINNFRSFGFKEVNDLKYGDVIAVGDKTKPSHLMIYLNNDQILHQRINTYSTVEIYNDSLKKITSNVFRHGSLC